MKCSTVSLMGLWQNVRLKIKVDEENVLWVINILSLHATRDKSLSVWAGGYRWENELVRKGTLRWTCEGLLYALAYLIRTVDTRLNAQTGNKPPVMTIGVYADETYGYVETSPNWAQDLWTAMHASFGQSGAGRLDLWRRRTVGFYPFVWQVFLDFSYMHAS